VSGLGPVERRAKLLTLGNELVMGILKTLKFGFELLLSGFKLQLPGFQSSVLRRKPGPPGSDTLQVSFKLLLASFKVLVLR